MTVEQKREIKEIRDAMNRYDDKYVLSHWDRYLELKAIEDEEYRKANQAEFDKFYEENIKGKTWEEIDPDIWGWYSDWHKDMYGYRPRHI